MSGLRVVMLLIMAVPVAVVLLHQLARPPAVQPNPVVAHAEPAVLPVDAGRQTDVVAHEPPRRSEPTEAEGDGTLSSPCRVGDLRIAVQRSWISDRLNTTSLGLSSSQFGRYTGSPHLLVELHIWNAGSGPSRVPPLSLVDEHGRSYGRSSEGALANDALWGTETVNPGVSKFGVAHFEVNGFGDHSYRLRVGPRDGVVGHIRLNAAKDR